LATGNSSHSTKAEIKYFLGNIETEALIHSFPRRHPEIIYQQNGDTTLLVRRGSPRPLFEINGTGKVIWSGCDGRTTPGRSRPPSSKPTGLIRIRPMWIVSLSLRF